MSDAFGALVQFLLAALGFVTTPDVTVLGLAVAVIAVAVLAIAIARLAAPAGTDSAPHPLRAIDISTLLPQSDPSADGHPRPRAPGVARAA